MHWTGLASGRGEPGQRIRRGFPAARTSRNEPGYRAHRSCVKLRNRRRTPRGFSGRVLHRDGGRDPPLTDAALVASAATNGGRDAARGDHWQGAVANLDRRRTRSWPVTPEGARHFTHSSLSKRCSAVYQHATQGSRVTLVAPGPVERRAETWSLWTFPRKATDPLAMASRSPTGTDPDGRRQHLLGSPRHGREERRRLHEESLARLGRWHCVRSTPRKIRDWTRSHEEPDRRSTVCGIAGSTHTFC